MLETSQPCLLPTRGHESFGGSNEGSGRRLAENTGARAVGRGPCLPLGDEAKPTGGSGSERSSTLIRTNRVRLSFFRLGRSVPISVPAMPPRDRRIAETSLTCGIADAFGFSSSWRSLRIQSLDPRPWLFANVRLNSGQIPLVLDGRPTADKVDFLFSSGSPLSSCRRR